MKLIFYVIDELSLSLSLSLTASGNPITTKVSNHQP
jgi:hypothetical protein